MDIYPKSSSILPSGLPSDTGVTHGQRAAEFVASIVGSWRFIAVQSSGIAIWVIVNSMRDTPHWDAYPYILMNLVLSLQAAYTAPMILMAQNRQAEKDRRILYGDFAMDRDSNKIAKIMALRLERIELTLDEINSRGSKYE